MTENTPQPHQMHHGIVPWNGL